MNPWTLIYIQANQKMQHQKSNPKLCIMFVRHTLRSTQLAVAGSSVDGANLLSEKSTAGWWLVADADADSVWEKSIASWLADKPAEQSDIFRRTNEDTYRA